MYDEVTSLDLQCLLIACKSLDQNELHLMERLSVQALSAAGLNSMNALVRANLTSSNRLIKFAKRTHAEDNQFNSRELAFKLKLLILGLNSDSEF